MDELTQEQVNEVFEQIKAEWDSAVEASGKSEAVFMATDNTGFVSNFLFNLNEVKLYVESQGLKMPLLIAGLTINSYEEP